MAIKNTGLPIGTVRNRKDGPWRKVDDGKWVKISDMPVKKPEREDPVRRVRHSKSPLSSLFDEMDLEGIEDVLRELSTIHVVALVDGVVLWHHTGDSRDWSIVPPHLVDELLDADGVKTITHNHPNNGPLSLDDLSAAVGLDLQQIRAVVHDGVWVADRHGTAWGVSEEGIEGAFVRAYIDAQDRANMIEELSSAEEADRVWAGIWAEETVEEFNAITGGAIQFEQAAEAEEGLGDGRQDPVEEDEGGIGSIKQVAKALGGRYTHRTPYIDSNGRKKYRYYYGESHGKGISNKDNFKEGAHLKQGDGHLKVTGVDGGVVSTTHSKTGESRDWSHDELSSALSAGGGSGQARSSGMDPRVSRLRDAANRVASKGRALRDKVMRISSALEASGAKASDIQSAVRKHASGLSQLARKHQQLVAKHNELRDSAQ